MHASPARPSDPLRMVRSFALLMAVLVATPVVITLKSPPPTASAGVVMEPSSPAVDADARPLAVQAPPIQMPIPTWSIAMIEALEDLGLDDGRDGPAWNRSGFDGAWSTVLERTDGPNEISCLLESTSPDRIETVVLELEIRDAERETSHLLHGFAQAINVVYPEAPRALARAVEAHRPWRSLNCKLTVGPLDRSGYELRLTVDRTPDPDELVSVNPADHSPAVGTLPIAW